MEDFNKTFGTISVKDDNIILIGDLNYNVLDEDKGTPLTIIIQIQILYWIKHSRSHVFA